MYPLHWQSPIKLFKVCVYYSLKLFLLSAFKKYNCFCLFFFFSGPVPKETIPALILDESTPIVQEGDIVPTISVKPLIPVRIAPPPPNIGAYIPSQAAPPVPPRTAPPIPPRVAGPKTDIKEQESKVELIQPTTSKIK